MDLRQGAMLRINPPTALLLLTDIVELKPGDWVYVFARRARTFAEDFSI